MIRTSLFLYFQSSNSSNQIKDYRSKSKPKLLDFFILLPNSNQYLENFVLFLEPLLADVVLQRNPTSDCQYIGGEETVLHLCAE